MQPTASTATAAPPLARPVPFRPAGTAATGTGTLRSATVVLYWCTAAAAALMTLVLIDRKAVWSDIMDGNLFRIIDADAADARASGAFVLFAALEIASTIVVSIWSLRAARLAQMAGAEHLTPGLACGGWYIPFAGAIVPFVQLRRVTAHHHGSPTQLNLWQGFTIAVTVLLAFPAATDLEVDPFVDDVSAMLTSQIVVWVFITAATVGIAISSSRGMRHAVAAS